MSVEYKFNKETWVLPANEFEKASGVYGISGQYNMPDNMSLTDVAEIMISQLNACESDEAYIHVAQRQIEDIERLNPQVAKLDYDREDKGDLGNIVWGILSGFNLDDIQFFIYTSPQPKEDFDPVVGLGQHQIYRFILNRFYDEKTDIHAAWMLSPKTFGSLKDRFNVAADWCPTADEIQQKYLEIRQQRFDATERSYLEAKQKYESLQNAMVARGMFRDAPK